VLLDRPTGAFSSRPPPFLLDRRLFFLTAACSF
jgi:hypothetical protein